jgi:hypothetical protein
MTPAAGPTLRRVGLLIEMVCLVALVTRGDDPWSLAGITVRQALIGGVALGFVLWAVGLALLLRAAWQGRTTKENGSRRQPSSESAGVGPD